MIPICNWLIPLPNDSKIFLNRNYTVKTNLLKWKEYDNNQKLQKKTGTIQSICDSNSYFSFLEESYFVLGSDIYNDNPVFLENLFYSSDYNLFPLQRVNFSPPPSISENKGFQLENFWIIVNHTRESQTVSETVHKYSDNLPILKKYGTRIRLSYRLKRWGLFSNTNGIYMIYLNKTKARTMTQTAGKKTYHFGNILILYTTQRKRNLIVNNILREFSLLFVSRIVLVRKYFFLPTPSISMYHHEVEMSVTSQSNLIVAWFFCLINPDLYMTINGETIRSWGETGLMAFYK